MLDHHSSPAADDDNERPPPWSVPADLAGAIADLRAAARDGALAERMAAAGCSERQRLVGAAMAIAWPIVFGRVTRPQELRRGHRVCAGGLPKLADTCLDRFYDDLEAVVSDLLRARAPINNLEGWITHRLPHAAVDAHRRRRGGRGALQRPRLPGWLADALGQEPWPAQLAIEILTWVGVPTTAGTSLWPLDSWAERRAAVTGDVATSTVRVTQREVEDVLTAMRTRPRWYQNYVERPLSAKIPPVAPALVDRGTLVVEPPALALTQPHEALDALHLELAAVAIESIERTLAADPDLALVDVVGPIIARIFGPADIASELSEPPHAAPGLDERVPSLAADPAALARVAAVVREILTDDLAGRG